LHFDDWDELTDKKQREMPEVSNNRIENWRKFSTHMEAYIRERTIEKYKMDETGDGFDLISISKPEICVWNILRYTLRIWNGKQKEHDLEKIAHYAELAWTLYDLENVSKNE
jgi:hypothetical protein